MHSQLAWQRPTTESQSTPGLCCWLSPSNQTPTSINTFAEPHYNATMAKVRIRKNIGLYHRSVADYEGPQCPGEAQTQQHIEYIATDGVGHSHVTHSWNHWYSNTNHSKIPPAFLPLNIQADWFTMLIEMLTESQTCKLGILIHMSYSLCVFFCKI